MKMKFEMQKNDSNYDASNMYCKVLHLAKSTDFNF